MSNQAQLTKVKQELEAIKILPLTGNILADERDLKHIIRVHEQFIQSTHAEDGVNSFINQSQCRIDEIEARAAANSKQENVRRFNKMMEERKLALVDVINRRLAIKELQLIEPDDGFTMTANLIKKYEEMNAEFFASDLWAGALPEYSVNTAPNVAFEQKRISEYQDELALIQEVKAVRQEIINVAKELLNQVENGGN